jgi:hypothetical protein
MPVSCTCCHFQKGSDLVCMGYSSAGCAHKCARKSLSQVGTIALQWFKCHCPSPRTLEALASECVWPGVFHCTFSSDNDSECVGGSSNASTGWGEAGRRLPVPWVPLPWQTVGKEGSHAHSPILKVSCSRKPPQNRRGPRGNSSRDSSLCQSLQLPDWDWTVPRQRCSLSALHCTPTHLHVPDFLWPSRASPRGLCSLQVLSA